MSAPLDLEIFLNTPRTFKDGICSRCKRYPHACNCAETEKYTAALVAEVRRLRAELAAISYAFYGDRIQHDRTSLIG